MYTKVYNPRIQTSDYEDRQLEHYTYRNSITDPAPQPFQTAVPTQFEDDYIYLHISSSSRNRTNFPNPAKFTFTPLQPIRNVKSVKVVQGTVPNIAAINTLPYVLLDIGNFNYLYDAQAGFDVASVLQFKSNPSAGYLTIDTDSSKTKWNDAKSRHEVKEIPLTLRAPDGSVVSLGSEAPLDPIDPSIQWSILLEFTVTAPKRLAQTVPSAVPYV